MRIVIICGFFPKLSGGAEYQAYLLAQRLKELNHRVFYIFIGKQRSIKHENGFVLIEFPKRDFLRKFGDCFFIYNNSVRRFLKKIKPDVIYQRVASGITYAAASYGASNNVTSIMHIAHQNDVEKYRIHFFSRSFLFDIINRILRIKAIRKIKYIFAQAYYQDELLYKNYNRHADLVIGNYHPLPEEQRTVERKGKIILWVANIKNFKRPELFAKIAEEFTSYDNTQFVMVGRGTDSFCTEINLPNLVGIGQVDQEKVNELMNNSYCLVNTSIKEGFSNVFIQAWQRYLPVISLSVNPDNVLTKFHIGFCSGTLSKLKDDLKTIINNPQLQQEMGMNAYSYAKNNHSLKNIDLMLQYFK